ncbi:MAG: hypothetical protein WCJ35_20600 [Planctomycetota bacterium]
MNITRAKMPCRRPVMQPARQRNRPGLEAACRRFLPAVAGALLLLADVGRSIGGCIDDPCKFPSLGYPFASSPSFHHRYDDASGTFCAPCYAYRPTCWRGWPDCCIGCPPPAGLMPPGGFGSPMITPPTLAPIQPTISRPFSPPTLPPPVSAPMVPPSTEPQTPPPPDVGLMRPQAPAATPPPEPKMEPATLPVLPPPTAPLPTAPPPTVLPPTAPLPTVLPPTAPLPTVSPPTARQQQSPRRLAGSVQLPLAPMPSAKPRINTHVDRSPVLLDIPQATELPEAPMPPRTSAAAQREQPVLLKPVPRVSQDLGIAPMPPGVSANILLTSVSMPQRAARHREYFGIAPMPPSVSANIVLTSASMPQRAMRHEEDLGIAPMPPGLPWVAHVPSAPPAKRVLKSSVEFDLAPMPPELPRLTQR